MQNSYITNKLVTYNSSPCSNGFWTPLFTIIKMVATVYYEPGVIVAPKRQPNVCINT